MIFNKYWKKYPHGLTLPEQFVNLLGYTKEIDENLEYKTDKKGNHEGSWQGLNRPTLSEEGMRSTVEKIVDNDLPTIENKLKDMIQVNIKDFSNHVINNDWTIATNKAIEYLKSIGGGKLLFPQGDYLVRNVVVPSNIEIVGSKGLTNIKAKDVFYTKTTSLINQNDRTFTVEDVSDVKIGDVITIKGSNIDLLVVTNIENNTLTIEPMRIFKKVNESHIGTKYSYSIGAIVTVLPQIFWVTQGLTTLSDNLDSIPKNGGIENVTFEGINFIGSKYSNKYENYSVYDLVGSGAIFNYRTKNVNIVNCSFDNSYSSNVLFYGWNTNFEFKSNKVSNTGYVIPLSVSPQERDSTTGFSIHWDQRFVEVPNEIKRHVSDSYIIENNIFNNCWNGGVFASGTNNGVIKNNDVNGFISHGISVYGGDLGIGSHGVTVEGNKVRNGRIGTDVLGYGMGIWLSVINKNCSVYGNIIENCEIAIQVNATNNTNISDNIITNCTTRYFEVKLRNINLSFSNNLLYQELSYTDSKTDSFVIVLDSSDTSSDNTLIIFKNNTYNFPSSYKGEKICKIIKSNDTTFINEKGNALVGFSIINDIVSPKKPKFISCDFTGFLNSGITSTNAHRINCLESEGSLTNSLNGKMNYNFKEVATINYGTTTVRPTNITLGYQYFDSDLKKPIWWNGANWVDSTGSIV